MGQENIPKSNRLDEMANHLEGEIVRAKKLLQESENRDLGDFNIRGRLYKIAFEIAPEARSQDVEQLHHWIKPRVGEVAVDVAAGTGFITKPICEWTKERVYAIDPSNVQLEALKKCVQDCR